MFAWLLSYSLVILCDGFWWYWDRLLDYYKKWLNRWETNEWTIILGSKDGCGKGWGRLGYPNFIVYARKENKQEQF